MVPAQSGWSIPIRNGRRIEMADNEEEDDKEQAIVWGTVTELNRLGWAIVKFDKGGETTLPDFWLKFWKQAPLESLIKKFVCHASQVFMLQVLFGRTRC
jgi:hypothetical protein